MLELKNISKTYKNARKKDFEAIKNISFYINKKETVGLIGDSGSGKTTIGQIITGLIMPSKGEMFFENLPLKYPVKRETRRKIQILFYYKTFFFISCNNTLVSISNRFFFDCINNFLSVFSLDGRASCRERV